MIETTASCKAKKERYPFVDFLRFFAVILMIIFHFSFDLKMFGYVDISFNGDPFWWAFPRVIVFFFLFSMGISFEITYELGIDWQKFRKRLLKIGVSAVLITLFTYFAYPKRWIYFGTLHCIFVCSLAAIPFRKRPLISLIVAVAILTPLIWGFRWPWIKLAHPSLDYIPALPWIGVVLLGMAAKAINLHRLKFPELKIIKFLSQHSLFIYLIHQPLLFGLVWLIYTLTQ